MGFCSIGRFLGVSHVSVFNWIKSFGGTLDDFKHDSGIEIVEIDEMYTYIGSKKTTVGYGLLLIEWGNALSTAKLAHAGQKQGKVMAKIQSLIKGVVCTDHWQAYNEFVPKDKLVQNKAETFTVEGYNSVIRHFFARLRRKTKCYSKCPKMLLLSLKLLMLKRNDQLTIST